MGFADGSVNGGAACKAISDCGTGAQTCSAGKCLCFTGYTCPTCDEECEGFTSATTWSTGKCTNECASTVIVSNTTNTNSTRPAGKKGRSPGAIAGIVIALLAVFAALLLFLRYMMSAGESDKPEPVKPAPRSTIQLQQVVVPQPEEPVVAVVAAPSISPSVYSSHYSHSPSVYSQATSQYGDPSVQTYSQQSVYSQSQSSYAPTSQYTYTVASQPVYSPYSHGGHQ